jgi:hypothetical protein
MSVLNDAAAGTGNGQSAWGFKGTASKMLARAQGRMLREIGALA